MKYAGFVFLAIVFFICSLGINLYFYYEELLKNGRKEKIDEGFTTSVEGIIKDNSGNIIKCNIIGQNISGGKCMDLSYIDQNGQIQTNKKVLIYPNYYVDLSNGMLTPYSYKSNVKQNGYIANTLPALIDTSNNINPISSTYPNSLYDPSIQHLLSGTNKSYSSYKATNESNGLPPGKMWFPNGDGTASIVDINDYDQNTYYHEPGTYSAGPRNFVPNYEKSSYISDLGSQNIQDYSNKDPIYLAGSPISSVKNDNICTLYANNPSGLERACNSLDRHVCASTNCCALLGGQKCVSANQNGPIMKSNYSDFLIMNRDYYYFQGKCYGMCPIIRK
jgi:hypothetical protein